MWLNVGEMLSSKPLLSIIIPTMLVKPNLLIGCLSSIKRNSLPKLANLDVIIVCNTNKNVSLRNQILKQVGNLPFKIQWVWLGKNFGYARAMNIGFSKTRSPLIFCLNDDVELAPHCINELLLHQARTRSDMVATTIYRMEDQQIDSQGFSFLWRGKAVAITPVSIANLEKKNDYWLKHLPLLSDSQEFFKDKAKYKLVLAEPFGPDAAGCLYTKKLLDAVGGYNKSFFAYLEDVDLALRARRLGYVCSLATKAMIYHHKHATSRKWPLFKVKRDLVNWWRICLRSYPKQAWWQFWFIILLERVRNLSGLLKTKEFNI